MKKFLICLSIILSAFILRIDCASASVNDFKITDFQADYYLAKDKTNNSTLKTIERITAEFPDFDQNHGIERVIPAKYDGHSTSLQIQSVKDENGADIKYSTRKQNDNLVLKIGSPKVYVHGKVNYVLTYTQRDVTKAFKDTNSDEFYWDVNGTGWSQSFDKVTATLHLSDDLQNALTGQQSCYYGVEKSTNKCAINRQGSDISTTSVSLGSGENVTLAVGFKQGTFSPHKTSIFELLEKYIVYIDLCIVVILFTLICLLKKFKDKSAPGRGTIVAEYLPPKDTDIVLSAIIGQTTTTWATATFVDLAVKHKIQILESGEKKLWKKIYSLKLVSIEGLSPIERSVVEALFGDQPTIGSQYDIKSSGDYKLANKLRKIYNQTDKKVNAEDYYINNKKIHKIIIGIAFIILIQSIILFLIYIESVGVIMLAIGMVAFAFSLVLAYAIKPLSAKGRELSDYLKGLKMYIKIAEADRIKVLQSPQGAARTPVDVNDGKAVLKLYERVLPYAVLFGIESSWTKVLGKYYEQQNMTPDWYFGPGSFNTAAFSLAMSDFTNSAAASSSYGSSSSGGSSGGGFSGGGGGGGGGGGW